MPIGQKTPPLLDKGRPFMCVCVAYSHGSTIIRSGNCKQFQTGKRFIGFSKPINGLGKFYVIPWARNQLRTKAIVSIWFVFTIWYETLRS